MANGSPFYVGSNAASATLALIDNTHSFNNGLQLAATADSTGTVFFAGTQLQATNGDTVVGLRGVGQLTISNGLASFGDMILGATNGATGNYSLLAGTNSIAQYLSVGSRIAATGMVRVTGGLLNVTGTNNFTYIGDAGVGQMLISNGAVALNNTLYVGSSGKAQGTLTMQAGSLVSTNGGAVIGLIGAGRMSMSGGSVTLDVLFDRSGDHRLDCGNRHGGGHRWLLDGDQRPDVRWQLWCRAVDDFQYHHAGGGCDHLLQAWLAGHADVDERDVNDEQPV